MTEEQKAQVKANLHSGAARVAKSTAEKAKTATGWRKWLFVAAAIVAAAVAWFTAGCTASYSQSAAGDIEYEAHVFPVDAWQK